jgi:hypothetical protein
LWVWIYKICVCVYMSELIYVYIYMCVCIWIYIYIYKANDICAHTHIWCRIHACKTHPTCIDPTPNLSMCTKRDMIFYNPKTQLLITLPMWLGDLLASFKVFFSKKKKKKSKSKSCYLSKDGQKLYLRVAMYHILYK